jgi:hypothetical protein
MSTKTALQRLRDADPAARADPTLTVDHLLDAIAVADSAAVREGPTIQRGERLPLTSDRRGSETRTAKEPARRQWRPTPLLALAGVAVVAAVVVPVLVFAQPDGPASASDPTLATTGESPATEVLPTSTVVPNTPGPTSVAQETPVVRIRTDPDGRGLVAIYSGGCELGARLVTRESADRVDVTVEQILPASVLPGQSEPEVVCAAVGQSATIGARLSQPLGDRTIWSGGVGLTPFDGSLLLDLDPVPAGFAAAQDSGSVTELVTPDEPPYRTATWQRSLTSSPDPGDTADACTPGRGVLTIAQGPPGSALPDRWLTTGTVARGTFSASVAEDNGGTTSVGSRALLWDTEVGTVALISSGQCAGDQILSQEELVDVAVSLHRAA